MKPVTFVTSIGFVLLVAVSTAQARPLHHAVHRHVVVEKNIVHRNVVVRPAPIRTTRNHLTTVRLAALPAGYSRLVHNDIAYYYVNGVYYVREPSGYVQVRPVAGIKLVSLPSAYTRIRVGSENLYRVNNTNYRKVNGFFIVV